MDKPPDVKTVITDAKAFLTWSASQRFGDRGLRLRIEQAERVIRAMLQSIPQEGLSEDAARILRQNLWQLYDGQPLSQSSGDSTALVAKLRAKAEQHHKRGDSYYRRADELEALTPQPSSGDKEQTQ